MEWKKGSYRLSDDKTELDLYYIVPALQQSYWAAGRPKEVVEESIRNSVCFGLFTDNRQVGFARVVTDKCTFAWICDVIVHPDHRSIGLGFERTVAYVTGLANVRDVIPFPRTPGSARY